VGETLAAVVAAARTLALAALGARGADECVRRYTRARLRLRWTADGGFPHTSVMSARMTSLVLP